MRIMPACRIGARRRAVSRRQAKFMRNNYKS